MEELFILEFNNSILERNKTIYANHLITQKATDQ